MKINSIGIVGISGLVGQNILTSLDMLDIEFNELHLFGFSTVGNFIKFRDTEYIIKLFDNTYLDSLDYVILAVDNHLAKTIIEHHKLNKCRSIIIDNSSEYRLDTQVPLVVPEINAHEINSFHKIIANPNCTTSMLVMLLKPLMCLSSIDKVIVSTYQAASGAGIVGLEELITQTKEYSGSKQLTTDFWKKQYVFNVFSHNSKIDSVTKYNQEELKMINETVKILDAPIKINPTCVRVPTLRSHCLSVNVQFIDKLNYSDIIEALEKFDGIKIINQEETNTFPEPVFTSGKPEIFIGRIRPEIDNLTNWSFFISGDQLLKGAAYNSVQILKYHFCKFGTQ